MSLKIDAVTLRPERAEDEAFLREVHASRRHEELEASGFPPEMKATFLDLQFRAQQAGYRGDYPGADFQIILLEGKPVGRRVVNRAAGEWMLVDIALLAEYRNRGIGTALIRELAAAAGAAGRPLRLFVIPGQRAGRLYQRLGFVKIGRSSLHDLMELPSGQQHPPTVLRMQPSLKLPFQFEAALLRQDLNRIIASEFVPHFNTAYYEGDWSVVPFRSVGGRADQIYPDPTAKDAFANTPLLARCPHVRQVLAAFPCPLQSVRFLRLKAGSVIKEHCDYQLGFEDGEVRLHIPVVTNPRVEFVLNGVRVEMQEGECWYHNFNLPHQIANRGTSDRVHLVLDCVVNDWLRDVLLTASAAA